MFPSPSRSRTQLQPQNLLLASLPADAFARIEPHLVPLDLHAGDMLAEAGGAVRHVYFPQSGVISLVVEMAAGQNVETAMIGRDGVLNAGAALDGKVSLSRAVVRFSGVAMAIATDRLIATAAGSEDLRSLLLRHEQVLLAEAQQSAACNASHRTGPRLCKWLLRMRDIAGNDNLTVTQDDLAEMIGVTRPSVTIAANELQKAGCIGYRRGVVRIFDAAGLKARGCECYGIVRGHRTAMLGPHAPVARRPAVPISGR